jgi:hypothetical protein
MKRFLLGGLLMISIFSLGDSALACGPEGNTPEKLRAKQEEEFSRMDSNHDGQMTIDEFSQYSDWEIGKGKSRETFFNSLDKNDDKNLSFSEWEVGFPPSQYVTLGC